MSAVETRLRVERGNLTVHTYQDVEDIIEANKALTSAPQKSDWGRHVASVPVNVMYQWLADEWARGNVNLRWGSDEFLRIVHCKLHDHDWLYLRTDL
jgi:hypothetical protein